MMAASYLCNGVRHSAFKMKISHKVLYGKKANLSHLTVIGARAFVHAKDATKLGHTPWFGMVCGFSQDESNPSRIWNPKEQ